MKTLYGDIGEVDILAIGVHPDDIELSCSGTILKHIDQGYKVGIADLTKGELGTRGNAETRKLEAQKAAEILKVDFRVNLEMQDGFFAHDNRHINNIIRIIRLSRPKIILANSVEDRHPDHGRAAALVTDSFFYSGLARINVDDLPAYRANTLYHYIQDKHLTPDICIDVTGFEKKKFESIKAFSTQFFVGDSKGPQTPISSKDFIDFIDAKMRVFGRSIGVTYAEGFTSNRTIGTENLFGLK